MIGTVILYRNVLSWVLSPYCEGIRLVNKIIVFLPPDFKHNRLCIMKSPAYETTCHKNVARYIHPWTGVHKLQHVSQLKYYYNF